MRDVRPPTRFYMAALGVLVALAGCNVGGGGDDADAPISVRFASPTPGASFTRDQVAPTGALVAQVGVELTIDGAPARVAISTGDLALADADADGRATVPVPIGGPVTLVATAYDDAGLPASTDMVVIEIADPAVDDCHGWLDLYQLDWEVGGDNPGIADPITVTMPLSGIQYRYVSNDEPRATLYADCTLIHSLAKAAPILHARGIVEVADIGIYNYRCIGGGTPPDCPNGISQHAYAKAIDIAGFTDTAGEFSSVNDDWVIDPSGQATCAAATEPGKDEFLHQVICELKEAGVWNIVLTPNYNSDHRNHFHVDLTPDDDFIRDRTPVDEGPDDL